MTNKDIKDFLEYCGITAVESTLHKIEHKIVIIDKYFKGNLDSLTLKQLHGFLSYLNKKGFAVSTKNDFIKVLRRFLRWKYKDWNVRFDSLKDLKCNGNDGRKLSKDDLLTPDERSIIINSIDSLKFKTLIVLLEETAGRPEELLKLVWKDINFDKREIKLHSSKTDKIRDIPIDKSIEHLKRYREECFYETPRANHKIFPISIVTFHKFLNKTEEKLKFQKHLYPYLWRHSVLTNMIKKLTPKSYEMFAGHSLETGMKTYAHLDTDDLRDELREKIFKIEKITKEEQEEIKELKKEIQLLKYMSLNKEELNFIRDAYKSGKLNESS